METLSKKLTDTAAILANLPKMLDLATERELAILAAMVKGYVDCGGPGEWGYEPGYAEDVLLTAVMLGGRALDKEAAESYGTRVMVAAIEYVRKRENEKRENDPDNKNYADGDYALLNSLFYFALYGEPLEVDLGHVFGAKDKDKTKLCSVRSAMEWVLKIEKARDEQKQNAEREARVALQVVKSPAKRKRRKAA